MAEPDADRVRLRRLSGSWQPIETAPQDGTQILVVNAYTLFSFDVVHWERSGGVYGWSTHEGIRLLRAYTHWMPLPEAPRLT